MHKLSRFIHIVNDPDKKMGGSLQNGLDGIAGNLSGETCKPPAYRCGGCCPFCAGRENIITFNFRS